MPISAICARFDHRGRVALWETELPLCHRPRDPGHGPNLRLTYKWRGKTVTESLPTPAAVRKAEREVAEFRRFQQLSREFVEVNEKSAGCARLRRP